jgi:hypothetical protein
MLGSAIPFSACAMAAGASARQRVMTINLFFIIRFFDSGLLPLVVLLVIGWHSELVKFLIRSSVVKV